MRGAGRAGGLLVAVRSGRALLALFGRRDESASATNVANRSATSQIALPKAACDQVYATTGYESSVTTLSQVSLASDMVFSDGSALELATVTGSVGSGLTATLSVAV